MTPDGRNGLRILLVEDHVDGADSLALLLRLAGHNVEIARDGLAAMDLGPRYRPDVVLLDLAMPRISGYEVARELPGRIPERKPLIVAVTGYGDPESQRRSTEAGIDLHLVKPVDTDYLFGLLERFYRVVGEPAEADQN